MTAEGERGPRTEHFTLPRPDGLIVRGTALVPADARGAVILCHGWKGFSRWAFFPALARAIADAGIGAISFDFSGSGIGEDGETFTEFDAFASNTYARELADLTTVETHARERGWIGSRLGLFGHSRGGGVAILHAAQARDLHALVTWSAIAHVRRWSDSDVLAWRARGYTEIVNTRTHQILRLGTELLEECEREGREGGALDVRAAAARVTAPWLIVHGTADETVPVADGHALHAAAASGAELRLIPNANHAFDMRHGEAGQSPALRDALDATVDFFETHLT